MLENGVDVDAFRLYAVARFPPGDCIPQSPTSLNKIFEAITYHGPWDYFNYTPLMQIARDFVEGDPEMEAWFQNYKKDLKSYNLLTNVQDCIESELVTSTEPPPAKKVKYDPNYCCPVEWKTGFIDHSLLYLTDVWEMFSGHYLVPDSLPTALLDRVRKGCVSVTWLVPSYLIPQLVKGVEVDTEFLQRYHILKVKVGGKVVYKKEIIGKNADVTCS